MENFEELFFGRLIIQSHIEIKLNTKHSVYKEDIIDALEDPYLVVVKGKQKQLSKGGTNYDIYAETEDGRILYIASKIFTDGNLFVITAYWANSEMKKFYIKESEVLRNEEEK